MRSAGSVSGSCRQGGISRSRRVERLQVQMEAQPAIHQRVKARRVSSYQHDTKRSGVPSVAAEQASRRATDQQSSWSICTDDRSARAACRRARRRPVPRSTAWFPRDGAVECQAVQAGQQAKAGDVDAHRDRVQIAADSIFGQVRPPARASASCPAAERLPRVAGLCSSATP